MAQLPPTPFAHHLALGDPSSSSPVISGSTDAALAIPEGDHDDFPDPARTWNPDARVYYSRRLKKQPPPSQSSSGTAECPPLPDGFPAQCAPGSPLVWSGQDLNPGDYLRHLSPADIVEVDAALVHFRCNTSLVFHLPSPRFPFLVVRCLPSYFTLILPT